MLTTTKTIRCDGRPDGKYCGNSVSGYSKANVKAKSEGLGWKTTGSWFDRLADCETHTCPKCQAAARGEEAAK